MSLFAIGAGAERAILVGLASLIILLAVVMIVLLRRIEKLVREVDDVFVWQHRRRTPVATIAGLVGALEKALDYGGMTTEQRKAIYRAIDEQLELFYSVDERLGAEPPVRAA